MSDESNNKSTSTEVSASSEAAEADTNGQISDKKRKKQTRRRQREALVRSACLVASIILPCFYLFLTTRNDEYNSFASHAFRLASTSFVIAAVIITIGAIDRNWSKSKFDLKSRILASILGTMLWLVWVGTGQLVFKAMDESTAGDDVVFGK
jgi:cation transport ATPase